MIAPAEQTHVPMVMWIDEGSARGFGISTEKLGEIARQGCSHDNLFHSVLGLLGVETSVYEEPLDIFARCRSQ